MLGAVTTIASIIGVMFVGGFHALRAARRRFAHKTKPDAPAHSATEPPADRPSVSMLCLNAIATDPEIEHLVDGITEDVTTLLARVPGFVVTARNSTFAYKGQHLDIRRIGRELGVRYVVEGSLRQIGDRIRLTI
ncbi:MAG: hypothetical protein O2910_01950 [Proteobacteria bacterium]|jgi:adenylate cyclase|nr:hypothetical protein [Pseudomonadota bacterium]